MRQYASQYVRMVQLIGTLVGCRADALKIIFL